jgi:hypothetical protein
MTFFVFLSDYKPASTNAPLPLLPTTGWEETTVLAAAMARNPSWPPMMVGGLRRRL